MNKNTYIIALLVIILSAQFAFSEDVLRPRDGIISPSNYTYKPAYTYGNESVGFKLGIEGGANANFFSQEVLWKTGQLPPGTELKRSTVIDPTVKSSGISPHVALVMDYSFNRTSAIQARIGYEAKNFQTSGKAMDLTQLGELTEVEAEYLDFTNWASIALNYRHNFVEGFFATIGAHSDFLINPIESELNITLANPNINISTLNTAIAAANNPKLTTTFPNTHSINIKGKVNDELAYQYRIAIDLGLGYDFKLTRQLSLVPQVRFQYFITPPIKDQVFTDVIYGTTVPITTEIKNRQLHTLQFVLALWYNF